MKKGMRKEIKKEKGKMLTLENVDTGSVRMDRDWTLMSILPWRLSPMHKR